MFKSIIAITMGLTAAFVFTTTAVSATEPAYTDSNDFLIKDCPESPRYSVHCDKIVFHIKDLGRFFCPLRWSKPTSFKTCMSKSNLARKTG